MTLEKVAKMVKPGRSISFICYGMNAVWKFNDKGQLVPPKRTNVTANDFIRTDWEVVSIGN